MAMIQVTSQRLRGAADSLQNLNAQFKTKAEEMTGKEQSLCQMWDGQAKSVFHTAFDRDRGQMEAFHGLISQYVQTLLEIAGRYEQAEARNTEIAGSRNY